MRLSLAVALVVLAATVFAAPMDWQPAEAAGKAAEELEQRVSGLALEQPAPRRMEDTHPLHINTAQAPQQLQPHLVQVDGVPGGWMKVPDAPRRGGPSSIRDKFASGDARPNKWLALKRLPKFKKTTMSDVVLLAMQRQREEAAAEAADAAERAKWLANGSHGQGSHGWPHYPGGSQP